ncbi:Dihydrodipicolinate synthase [Lunatimonas lonarensis]|uniref:Dihydrodipicolinate synthase n=1 Tax=Lunatimonas lonarensis TaxID=1232681 RepID=R7ZU76_9BACT|nr:dihydrodipicolinate synthase family protein [Lunatimonas lonarensis]EON77612.1 Dihydrodipicolinate synthase [Lunatimonas lonarensis]
MKSDVFMPRRVFLAKLGLGFGTLTLGLDAMAQSPHLALRNEQRKDSFTQRFIPVMLTVYRNDGSIDYDGVSRLMDYYLKAGAKGFFANCLSSEMYHLSDEERIRLTHHVVKHTGGSVPVVSTGSFGESIQAKADFTKRIYDTGVDAVILISSHFAEREESDERLIQHLGQFMQYTEGIPVGTYECPSPYKRIVSPTVLNFLVGSERFIYHKDTTEDIVQIRTKIDRAEGSGLGIYNAHIGSAAASLQYGGAGLSPIAGNFYPEIIAWLCEHASDPNKQEEVDWIQERLRVAEQKIGRQYQLGARYFLKKRGLEISLNCRSTEDQLESTQVEVLDDLAAELNIWQERLGI